MPFHNKEESRKNEGKVKLVSFMITFAILVGCSTSQPTPNPSPIPSASSSPSPSWPPFTESVITHSPSASPQSPVTASPSLSLCADTRGTVAQETLPSRYLADGLRFSIYLPPCHGADPAQQYPVLYLFHGQTFNDDQWVRLGAPQTADRLIAGGDASPFIIVMPYDKSSAQPSEDPFDQALQEELLPYIEEAYRTCGERTCRAAGGLSRGGGWSIHYGLTRPDLFSAIGGHSPAIFDSEGPRLSRLLNAIPAGLMPRWFLDIGEGDRLTASTRSFEQSLTSRGIEHDWRLYTGVHNEEYWSSHIEEYLRWYTQGWE